MKANRELLDHLDALRRVVGERARPDRGSDGTDSGDGLAQRIVQLAREHAPLLLHPRLYLPSESAAVGKLRACPLGLLADAHGLFQGGCHAVETLSDLTRLTSTQQRQAGIKRTLLDVGKRVGDALERGNRATGEPEDRNVGQNDEDRHPREATALRVIAEWDHGAPFIGTLL